MKTEIENLIKKELESARSKFPRKQASTHEGYAVLLEEIEECETEMEAIKHYNSRLWDAIKRNNNPEIKSRIKELKAISIQLLEEAIQIAAMIKRFEEDNL